MAKSTELKVFRDPLLDARLAELEGAAIDTRLTALEDQYVSDFWFERVSATTGGITPPEGASFVLDYWPGGVDAIVSATGSDGRPNNEHALDAEGDVISTTLDAAGAYALSDTPVDADVCLVYRYRCRREDYDSDYSLGGMVIEPNHDALVGIQGNGTEHLSAAEVEAIAHTNRAALDQVAGTNTGDQDLSGLVPKATTITASGLAMGGGDLSANRTITVTAATDAEAVAMTVTNRVVTPSNLRAALNANEYYGVSWNETTDTYTRTGKLAGIAVGSKPPDSLIPIQTSMRRCLLLDSGEVNYYLSPTDSTKKLDGTTASNLTGTDGQVVVEIPQFYYRYSYTSPIHTWEISLHALSGFSLYPSHYKDGAWVPYRYYGAYEGVLYDTSQARYADGIYQTALSCTFASADKSITANGRTAPFKNLSIGDRIAVSGTAANNSTITVAGLVSDIKITVAEALTDETAAATAMQTQKDWTATTGDKLASVSGKIPITFGTRAQFRAVAKNRGTGWRQLDYDLCSAIQLLYLVEYASFNSQSMIGAGITNVGGWDVYNDYNPIARTGNSNPAGNVSGNTAGSSSAATEVSKYLTYRGIENLYGHIWKWVDGINIQDYVPYASNNANDWADDTSNNYVALGVTLANTDGYQATLAAISRGFLPLTTGASSATKITDYYYRATGWRVVIVSGSALHGGLAGAFCVSAGIGSGGAYRELGGRLCF